MRFFELKKYICFLEPLLLLQSAGKHFRFLYISFCTKEISTENIFVETNFKMHKIKGFFFRRFSVSDII